MQSEDELDSTDLPEQHKPPQRTVAASSIPIGSFTIACASMAASAALLAGTGVLFPASASVDGDRFNADSLMGWPEQELDANSSSSTSTVTITQLAPQASITSASPWANWEQLGKVLNSNEQSNNKERRQRNRVMMQCYRQRMKDEIQQMKQTVVQLEKQYATLWFRVESGEIDERVIITADNARYSSRKLIALMRQLRAENALLHAAIPEYEPWKARLRAIMASRWSLTNPKFDAPNEISILEDHEAALKYQFRRVNEEFVNDRILYNTRIVQQVHHRLAHDDTGGIVDHFQILEWDIRRQLIGTNTYFSFTKRFTCGFTACDMLEKTWRHLRCFKHIKKVETDTLRFDVLQEVNCNVDVVGRDARSNDDRSVFRTLFLQYKLKATLELADMDDPTSPKRVENAYLQGFCSINPERPMHSSMLDAGTDNELRWADLNTHIYFLDVIDLNTGEKFVEVRWVGTSDYKTEPLANRNMTDTVMTVLRWKLDVIAPALNLISF